MQRLLILLLLCSATSVLADEPEQPSWPSWVKNAVPATMGCREVVRSAGYPQAFFGFFHDTCLDAFGQKHVYVTAFDFLDGKSPAQKSGLEIRDQITNFMGCEIKDSTYLTKKMENFTAANMATIAGQDDGKAGFVMIPTEKLYKRSEGRRKFCRDIGLKPAK